MTSGDDRSLADGESSAPRLSAFDYSCVVAGGIIGVGIFFTPSVVAQKVENETQLLLAWVLGGLLAIIGGLVFAELAGRVPGHGGMFRYVHQAFGRVPAFLYGWANWLVIQAGALGIVTVFAVEHAVEVVSPGTELKPVVLTSASVAIILAFTLLNVWGLRFSRVFQNVLVLAKLAAVMGLVMLAVFSGGATERAPSESVASTGGGAFALLGAILPVMFSFGGWQQGPSVAGSAKSTQAVSKGIVAGILAVVLAYLAINLAIVELLGFDGARSAGRTVGIEAAKAALEPVGLGDLGKRVFAFAVVLSAVGIMNTFLLAPPFVLHAMAKKGLFFRRAKSVSSRGTPVFAVWAQGGWAILLLVLTRQVNASLGELVDGVVFVDWLFMGLCGVALWRLRRRSVESDGFRVPFGSVLVPLFVVAAVLVMVGAIWTRPEPSMIGGAIVVLGLPFALVQRSDS